MMYNHGFPGEQKHAPKQTHDICEKWFNGDIKGSLDAQLKAFPLIKALFAEVNPIPVKAALNLQGKNVGSLRLPLTEASDKTKALLKDDAEMVCLIKPQFEAGREKVGKKGVVRDPAVHEEVINTIIDFVKEIGFYVLHLEYSPIKGPEGNIEYLIHISTQEKQGDAIDVAATVAAAHGSLDK